MPLPAAGQFAGGCYQQGTGHRVLLSQAGQDESDKKIYKYKVYLLMQIDIILLKLVEVDQFSF